MEAKKTDRADLTRKSTFFFSIGLLLALTFVTSAFEFSSYEGNVVDLRDRATDELDWMKDIPVTIQTPPPPPQPLAPTIIEVENEEIIDDLLANVDVEATQQAALPELTVSAELPVEDADFIVVFAEESASPDGGIGAFYSYVKEKMKYPAPARRIGVEGKVFVEFIINKDGSISDVKTIKGIGAGCDEEAVRVVQAAPRWNPGKQRGKPVRQRMVLPIVFKLG
jgi:protein TonB